MKYIEIQKYLNKLKVFSTEDLRIIDNNYDKSKVSKWAKLGYIKSIIRGFYMISDVQINQNLLYQVSNKIYSPSYISLESALNYYSVIPEQSFSVTAVSVNKTMNYSTEVGYFSYKKIKSQLYWGYKVYKTHWGKFLISELEKAILDYLYLNPNIKTELDFEGLRWNKDVLNEKLDFEKLEEYSKLYLSPTIGKKINKLLTYLKNDSNFIY